MGFFLAELSRGVAQHGGQKGGVAFLVDDQARVEGQVGEAGLERGSGGIVCHLARQ
jgi:hypothetical protein